MLIGPNGFPQKQKLSINKNLLCAAWSHEARIKILCESVRDPGAACAAWSHEARIKILCDSVRDPGDAAPHTGYYRQASPGACSDPGMRASMCSWLLSSAVHARNVGESNEKDHRDALPPQTDWKGTRCERSRVALWAARTTRPHNARLGIGMDRYKRLTA